MNTYPSQPQSHCPTPLLQTHQLTSSPEVPPSSATQHPPNSTYAPNLHLDFRPASVLPSLLHRPHSQPQPPRCSHSPSSMLSEESTQFMTARTNKKRRLLVWAYMAEGRGGEAQQLGRYEQGWKEIGKDDGMLLGEGWESVYKGSSPAHENCVSWMSI